MYLAGWKETLLSGEVHVPHWLEGNPYLKGRYLKIHKTVKIKPDALGNKILISNHVFF
jgi:hypothetical protein